MSKKNLLWIGGFAVLSLLLFAIYDAVNKANDAVTIATIEQRAAAVNAPHPEIRRMEQRGAVVDGRFIHTGLGFSVPISDEYELLDRETMVQFYLEDMEGMITDESAADYVSFIYGFADPYDYTNRLAIQGSIAAGTVESEIDVSVRMLVGSVETVERDYGVSIALDSSTVAHPPFDLVRKVGLSYALKEGADPTFVLNTYYVGVGEAILDITFEGTPEWVAGAERHFFEGLTAVDR